MVIIASEEVSMGDEIVYHHSFLSVKCLQKPAVYVPSFD